MNLAQIARRVVSAHGRLYQRSDGRVGHRLLGVPCLLLRTTGRRTGRTRTTTLSYARDGEHYLLVASNWGGDTDPAWLHNLRATPDAEIQIARERLPVTARVIAPGDDDYDRLWQIINDRYRDRYRNYQRGTDRPIPVIALAPRTG